MARPGRKIAQPEDLQKGAIVFYASRGGERKGVVRDAYAPLNEFWIADATSDELIRDEMGDVVSFRSEDLLLPDTAEAQPKGTGVAARVLVIGTEDQMLSILQHFGAPDNTARKDPQQILAVPCDTCRCSQRCVRFDPCKREMCDPECSVLQVASDGIDATIMQLARKLRPDVPVRVRPYFLKQALEQIGPDLTRLAGYYCLAAVTLPYSQGSIGSSNTKWERWWKEEVRCQVDLNVSADGPHEPGDHSTEDTAKRVLKDNCQIVLSESIWSENEQLKLRQRLGVDMPLKFFDGPESKVYIVLLPSNVQVQTEGLVLKFSTPSADGSNASGDMSMAQWQENQDQFSHLPKLPAGWIRVKSRKTKEVYFWDTKASKSSFDFPLPEGWTKQVSKSTGKAYYFNAKKRKSVFDIPTE